MSLISRVFNFLFDLLYKQLAWTYDQVAWVVSAGLWKDWVFSILPYLRGSRILEFGYGPGHLQKEGLTQSYNIFGVDISPSMAKICNKRLKTANLISSICLANAQISPFPTDTFDQIVATFPAPYIFEKKTLNEIDRMLVPDGELLIIPTAQTTSKFPILRFFSWLFNLSTQEEYNLKYYQVNFLKPLSTMGYHITQEEIMVKKSKVLLIIAKKKG